MLSDSEFKQGEGYWNPTVLSIYPQDQPLSAACSSQENSKMRFSIVQLLICLFSIKLFQNCRVGTRSYLLLLLLLWLLLSSLLLLLLILSFALLYYHYHYDDYRYGYRYRYHYSYFVYFITDSLDRKKKKKEENKKGEKCIPNPQTT